MQTRRIAGTDLEWSRLGLGCWAMGGEYWGDDIDDNQSIRAIHAAEDRGINWVDTAPLYGKGHADEVLAKALRGRKMAIATKVGVRWDGEHAESDLTPKHLESDVNGSLRRLGLTHIDLLQVHWPCQKNTPLEESFGALEAIVKSGKVRYLGVSNYDAESLRVIAGITSIVSLQTPYSMLRREFEAELQPTCSDLGLSTLAYEPLCRGLLTGKYREKPSFPPSDLRYRDERFSGPAFFHAQRICGDLRRVGERVNAPLAALALGWALQRCDFVIAGAKREEQVQQNASISSLLDREKLWTIVDKILAIHGGVPRL